MTMPTMPRRSLLGVLASGAMGCVVAPTALAQPSKTNSVGSLPQRGEFLIRGAYIVSMDTAIGDVPQGDIHVRNGVIIAVGPRLSAPGAKIIGGTGMIALPGFIDTHFHLWSSILRSAVESYFPLTLRVGPLYKPNDSYQSVRLGVAEAMLSGVTTINDWCHNVISPAHADAEIRALQEMGIRGRFSYGWGQDLAPEHPMDIQDVARVKQQWSSNGGLLSLGVAMRTPVEYQRGNIPIDVLKQDWKGAKSLGLPITIHNRPGVVTVLQTNGLLGPDVLLVHPQGFSADEIKAIAEAGVKISSSPCGENRTGNNPPRGPIQYRELSQAGVVYSLSVDEVVTNGKVDFFSVLRELVRSNGQRTGNQKPLEPRKTLELATIDGARALGLEDQVGSLTPGKRADITLVRSTDANMVPLGDIPTALVLSGEPGNVDTVIIDGRIMIQKGTFTSLDLAKILREANASAHALRERDAQRKG